MFAAVRTQREQDTAVAAMRSHGLSGVWLPGIVERPTESQWTWVQHGQGRVLADTSGIEAHRMQNTFQKANVFTQGPSNVKGING